jgi:hypothetical protein
VRERASAGSGRYAGAAGVFYALIALGSLAALAHVDGLDGCSGFPAPSRAVTNPVA